MTNKDKEALYNAIYVAENWCKDRLNETSSRTVRAAIEEEMQNLKTAKIALERLSVKS